ncbi:hypothetical protein CBR_g49759 [Chara braunii]|uniref:Uncharacterized protein n=1 Tax=Chara braunii TaxID=69332 RepID=A0A388M602_CHABU|nr:hypothetical protein CBR_g49759 [Chara braunii]|eukprot:GBG89909.1 hypothetical protein CBR_g49759 [Chara braunii]
MTASLDVSGRNVIVSVRRISGADVRSGRWVYGRYVVSSDLWTRYIISGVIVHSCGGFCEGRRPRFRGCEFGVSFFGGQVSQHGEWKGWAGRLEGDGVGSSIWMEWIIDYIH